LGSAISRGLNRPIKQRSAFSIRLERVQSPFVASGSQHIRQPAATHECSAPKNHCAIAADLYQLNYPSTMNHIICGGDAEEIAPLLHVLAHQRGIINQ
jgi:hypothetical protein